jgi:hypothetical protein
MQAFGFFLSGGVVVATQRERANAPDSNEINPPRDHQRLCNRNRRIASFRCNAMVRRGWPAKISWPVADYWLVLANGTLLIAFNLFCFGAALWRHFHPGPPAAFAVGQGHALARAACRECRALHDRSWRLGRTLVDAVLKRRFPAELGAHPRRLELPNCRSRSAFRRQDMGREEPRGRPRSPV